jgi:hypothetical protein
MARYIRKIAGTKSDYSSLHGGHVQIEVEVIDWWAVIRDLGITTVAFIIALMVGCPHYNVWQQGLAGQAELRRAEQNRQIAIQEARAKQESATLLAQAEVERAKGVASANKIIADGLKGNDEYLRYLWIDRLASSQHREVIYIPTEANLPILEANRLTLRNPKLPE